MRTLMGLVSQLVDDLNCAADIERQPNDITYVSMSG